MNIVAVQVATLPSLVDRAATALANARTSAEVLEARDMATVAYDAAKSAARLARAKNAHDELLSAIYHAQADSLEIEARAKRRLADEYDAAQERGEILKHGERTVFSPEKVKGTEVIPPKEVHDARVIRDAEDADPGIVKRTVREAAAACTEPTKALVRRAVKAVAKRSKPKRVPLKQQDEPSQHDRDLCILQSVWDAACETARAEFLRRIIAPQGETSSVN